MRLEEAEKITIDEYSKWGRDWERCWVPIYKSFASIVVENAQIKTGDRVLDVGTGTGLAAFFAASKVGERGRVVGIDVAEGMLRIASEKHRKSGISNLSFRVMDASNLSSLSDSFQAVISNFGIPIYRPDAFSGIYNVMEKGGRLSFNIWSTERNEPGKTFERVFDKHKVSHPSLELENCRAAASLLDKISEKYGAYPPLLVSLLEDVGFRDVEVKKKIHKVIIASSREYVEMFLSGGIDKAELLEMQPEVRDRFLTEVVAELDKLVSSRGLVVDWTILYFTGVK